MQTSKLVPSITHERVTGPRRRKLPATNPHRQPVVHQRRNPKLQEPSVIEDYACFIPTIVNVVTNCVTNVNPHSVNVPIYNESTKNLIHNLKESINEHNKKKGTHPQKKQNNTN